MSKKARVGRTYGYVRVSSKDQNERRQVDAITPYVARERDILIDKQSGKDFNRPQYQALKRRLKKGDVIVIQSLDRLGRNYAQIKDEWRDLGNMGVGIRVLDFPMLNTVVEGDKDQDLVSAFISNIVLEVLSFVAENERNNIRARQAQGIASAKQRGVKFGRDVVCPESFYPAYCEWSAGRITGSEAVTQAGMKKSTFYKRARELKKLVADATAGIVSEADAATYDPVLLSHALELAGAGT